MIYQFEHEEIEACGDCPCCDSIGGCALGGSVESLGEVPADCPLVAISKTETTSEPCEWCKGDVSQYFDVNWYDFIDGERGTVNHCPNCGRKLN